MAIDIQINLGLALLILGVLGASVGIYYISYLERKERPDKEPSMVTRTIMISLVIIGIILSVVYVSGQEVQPWQYMGFLVIIALVFASQYYEVERTKIAKPDEIFQVQMEHVFASFAAKPDYKTFGHTWALYKVSEIPGGKIFDVVASSLIRTNLGHILVQSNPYDKSILSHELDPDTSTVEQIFGQLPARKYDEERVELLQKLREVRNETQKEA